MGDFKIEAGKIQDKLGAPYNTMKNILKRNLRACQGDIGAKWQELPMTKIWTI